MKREPVRVPGVGEEPRYTLEQVEEVVEELKRRQARADAAGGKNLVGWFAGNSYGLGEAIVLLHHFTQQPAGATCNCLQDLQVGEQLAGVGAGLSQPDARRAEVSADSDGNQQPQGGGRSGE